MRPDLLTTHHLGCLFRTIHIGVLKKLCHFPLSLYNNDGSDFPFVGVTWGLLGG